MIKQEELLVISSKRNICSINLNDYKQIKVTRRVLYKVIDLKEQVYKDISDLVSKKILSSENDSLEDPIEIIFVVQFLRSLYSDLSNYKFSEIICPIDLIETGELFGYYLFKGIGDRTGNIMVKFIDDKDLNSDVINPTQETINNIAIEVQTLPNFVFELLKMQTGYDYELFDDFRRSIDRKYSEALVSDAKIEPEEDFNIHKLKDRENLIRCLKEIKIKLKTKGKSFNLKSASELIPKVGRSTLYDWLPKAGLDYDSNTKTIIDLETGETVV